MGNTGNPLFSLALLKPYLIHGRVYPMITLPDLRKPSYVYGDDFFFLEKYEVPRTSDAFVANARAAARYQQVKYFMSDGIYMASYIYMGGYDVGVEPTWIDISSQILNGNGTIIDDTADVNHFLYIYRVVTMSNNTPCVSAYLIGIESVEFNEQWENTADDLMDGLIVVKTSEGAGRLQRRSRDGTMVMKGFPMMTVNPRYRGPIEGCKENARRINKDAALDTFEIKIASLDAFLEDTFEIMGFLGAAATTTERHNI